jgi:hypothetical protein
VMMSRWPFVTGSYAPGQIAVTGDEVVIPRVLRRR